MSLSYEAVIGLEVHCQVATESKLFCGCRVRPEQGRSVAEIAPNSYTCPVCTGHPGTLPVVNRKVIEFAVQAGLATHCKINTWNEFSRKNFFYPDLPKGYQISQYETPICEEGWMEIHTSSGSKKIRIERIHIEEDAGKNFHRNGYSLINFNRAGIPLLEIVSAPDLRTSEEAVSYLKALHNTVTFLGISDGNLQEGNFRCDVNVSVRPAGSDLMGVRVEIKNLNSFRFIEKAIDYEIGRQIECLRSKQVILQETRSYDETQRTTISLRFKEEAEDYRYFSEPDLVHLTLDLSWIEALRIAMPELPNQKRRRLIDQLGLLEDDASLIYSSYFLASFFEELMDCLIKRGLHARTAAKFAANWLGGEVLRLVHVEKLELTQVRVTPAQLSQLIALVFEGALSHTAGKRVLTRIWSTGESVERVIEKEDLKQISDTGVIERAIQQVMMSHQKEMNEYQEGKQKLFGFFVGQVMKELNGKGNPTTVSDILMRKLQRTQTVSRSKEDQE